MATPPRPRPPVDRAVDDLIESGVPVDEIMRRVRSRASQPVKDKYLRLLVDRNGSPQQDAVVLTVADWGALDDFFAEQSRGEDHPLRIYQQIRQDIREAVSSRDAQALIKALLLQAKAQYEDQA